MRSGAGFLILSLLVLGASCFLNVHLTHFQQICAGAVPDAGCPKDSAIALFSAHLSSFHYFSSSDMSPFVTAILLLALIGLFRILSLTELRVAGTMPAQARREYRSVQAAAFRPFVSWMHFERYPSCTN